MDGTMIDVRVTLSDESGEDLEHHVGQHRGLTALSRWHEVPGMGLGRECRGFLRWLYVEGEAAKLTDLVMLTAPRHEPLRVRLWEPGQRGALASFWLVHPSTDRGEVDQLRALMWPTGDLPRALAELQP